MSELPRDHRVNELVDRFISGTDDDRDTLLSVFGSLDHQDKYAAYYQLRTALETRFSPQLDFTAPSPGSAPTVRAWLLSAVRSVAGPSSSGEVIRLLADYAQESREPAETVRYWALANLYDLHPEDALELCRNLRDDSESVRALSTAMLAATGRPDALDAVLAHLRSWQQNPHVTWLTLRALRVVPVPAAASHLYELVMDVLRTGESFVDRRNALTYDALLALAAVEQIGAIAGLPADLVSRLAALATQGGGPHHVRRVAAALMQAEPGARSTIAAAITAAHDLDPTVRAIFREAGLVASLDLPSGADRLELAYHLVLKNPAKFEVLDTLNPAEIRQMAEGLLGTASGTSAVADLLAQLRADARGPGALWRTWVETTQPARLTQD